MPNVPSLDSLLEIFSFEKKADLVRRCKELTISSEDFFKLVLACDMWGLPFLHAITHKDKVPPHLVPKDSEIDALQNTPAGTALTGGAAKAISKLAQAFEERRYLVGHIFFTPDKSELQSARLLRASHLIAQQPVHLTHPRPPQRRHNPIRPEFVPCCERHLLNFGVQLRITVMGAASVSTGEFTRTRCPSEDTSYPICPAVGPRS